MLETNSQKNIILTCEPSEENDTHVGNQSNSVRKKLNENTDNIYLLFMKKTDSK